MSRMVEPYICSPKCLDEVLDNHKENFIFLPISSIIHCGLERLLTRKGLGLLQDIFSAFPEVSLFFFFFVDVW
jgi:hypothetical protein